jgi:hypothetical protein
MDTSHRMLSGDLSPVDIPGAGTHPVRQETSYGIRVGCWAGRVVVGLALQGWGSEAPREALIAFAMWLFGLAVGSLLAHRKIVKPARERHEELLARHDTHDEHLSAIKEGQ